MSSEINGESQGENQGILARIPGLAYIGLVLTPLFWAGNAVVARGTVDSIPPLSMSFWRWIIALVILLPFGLPGMWRHRHTIRQRFGSMLALATFSVAAFNSPHAAHTRGAPRPRRPSIAASSAARSASATRTAARSSTAASRARTSPRCARSRRVSAARSTTATRSTWPRRSSAT